MQNEHTPLTILVPTDFSKISRYGFKMARQIAKTTKAHIHLVNWVNPPKDVVLTSSREVDSGESRLQDIYTLEIIKKNKQKLAKWRSKHEKFDISTSIRIGSISEDMLAAVDELAVDMIVMGTSGERDVSEFFSGNHTEQVINKTSVPVMTVKKLHKRMNFKDIILSVDLSDQSQAIEQVVYLAKLFGATIHLLFVDTSGTGQKKEAIVQLRLIAMKHKLEKFTLNYVQDSEHMSGLRSLAQIKRSDLIAVVTEQTNFLVDLFSESTVEELVNKSKRPVIAISME